MRRLAILLVLLLALPQGMSAGAGARDDLALGHPARAVALAGDGSALGVGMADEGSTTSINPGRAQDTWMMLGFDDTGYNVLQRGGVDPAACNDPVQVQDTCDSDVVALAMSRDGTRLAVAGAISGTQSSVVLVSPGGVVRRDELAGAIQDIAISDDGKVVFAVLDSAVGGGTLYRYAWGQTITRWSQTIPGDPSFVAMSPDGAVAYVDSGVDLRAYGSSATDSELDNNFPGDPRAAAVSGTPGHVAVAGSSQGDLRVYSDASMDAARAELNLLSNHGSLNVVAIADDGSRIMGAWNDGTIQVRPLRLDPLGVGAPAMQTTIAGLRDVQMSDDGKTLLVATATSIAMYDVDNPLTPLWTDTVADATVAMAGDGGRVAAVFGSTLRAYEPSYELELTVQHPGPMMPGSHVVINATVQHLGNRVETVAVEFTGPAWGLSSAPTTLTLAPGATRALQFSLDVPANQAPGPATFNVRLVGRHVTQVTVEATVPEFVAFAINQTGLASSLAVDAGGSATFSIPVKHVGNVPAAPPVSLRVQPAGWTARVVSGDGSLAPGAQTTLKVALTAPANAAQLAVGHLNVTIDGTVVDLSATVGARFGVRSEGPERIHLVAGKTTVFNVTVTNTGNAPDSYNLIAGQVPVGWTLQFTNGFKERYLTDVPAGETVRVALQISAPADATGPDLAFTVVARSVADNTRFSGLSLLASVTPVEEEPSGGVAPPAGHKSPLPVFVLPLLYAAWRRRRLD